MKNRKPPKPRCLVTKAMRESKLFAPKTIPNKKGKGVTYNRAKQDRSDLSGPFLWAVGILKSDRAILVLTDEGREAIRSGI